MNDYIRNSKNSHTAYEKAIGYESSVFDAQYDDTKRHLWMLQQLSPILEFSAPKTLLTIGDGRGREANFFEKCTKARVTASDIDDTKLRAANRDGYVSRFQIADAENLLLGDESFDIVFAKESLHHLPRPMVGIYEMLRVSKIGALFIEPYDANYGDNDPYPSMGTFDNSFENTENYLYRFSIRELFKAGTSLGCKYLVVKGFNDPWKPDFIFSDWDAERKILDELGRNGTRQFNLMIFFLAKDFDIPLEIQSKLKEFGFAIYILPQNNEDLKSIEIPVSSESPTFVSPQKKFVIRVLRKLIRILKSSKR